jgi:hypothetical protein
MENFNESSSAADDMKTIEEFLASTPLVEFIRYQWVRWRSYCRSVGSTISQISSPERNTLDGTSFSSHCVAIDRSLTVKGQRTWW